jgi:hypothetical protein
MTNFDRVIAQLESEWALDGFFGRVRDGDFDQTRAQSVLAILRQLRVEDNDLVPQRLVALLWYLPSYLGWQTERVEQLGGSRSDYERFITEVMNALEDALGTP